MSGANVTSIISTNVAVGLLIGTVTGPLLRRFSIREISMCAAILFSLGVISMRFAFKYIHFMIFYGFITATGMGTLRLTSSLALNIYFSKKRRKVVGVALALRSIGSITFPYIITFLLSHYNPENAVLLIGGVFLHTICASLLMRPVEWYTRESLCKGASNALIDVDLLHESKKNKKFYTTKNPHSIMGVINQFDFFLFKNRKFLSITIGMMFSAFSDLSFSTLFPLILSDLEFDNNRIALFISSSYISNIIIRFTIPFIGDYFKRSSKFMYGLSCCLVIIGRSAIITFAKTTTTLVIPILWGAAKGMRTVYWTVILADNVPARKLSSAESLQMVLNGIICLVCGPLLGLIKDWTGTYVSCVYVLNGFTSVTCIVWTLEYVYYICKKKNSVHKRHSI